MAANGSELTRFGEQSVSWGQSLLPVPLVAPQPREELDTGAAGERLEGGEGTIGPLLSVRGPIESPDLLDGA